MGHETKLRSDSVLTRQRAEITELKEALAQRKRDSIVQSGRIEHLESEVKERRAELDAKSAAIRDLETLLQSEREAEHGMSASKAEALARIAGMERTAHEQAETIKRLRDDLAAERVVLRVERDARRFCSSSVKLPQA